jgi:hypothetical protein
VVGAGVDCGGAVDSLLAGLAFRLGRLDEAREQAGAGLALETRVGSAISITRTESWSPGSKAPPSTESDLPVRQQD